MTIDPKNGDGLGEPSGAEGFALWIETACSEFEVVHGLLNADIRVVPSRERSIGSSTKTNGIAMRPLSLIEATVRKALLRSFVFSVRRASRILEERSSEIPVPRIKRTKFLNLTRELAAVRDVNEHGFDKNGKSRPTIHTLDGNRFALDETSSVIQGLDSIFMGPVNLAKIYPLVKEMQTLAGFRTLPIRRQLPPKASSGCT